MTSIDHKSFYFHTICDYMILLNQFEEIVEENNFSHYAFGLSNFQEYLIDEKLTRIVALKKMLHSLLNIKKDLHNSAEFLPKYTDRINFLELKLKSRLKLETHNETQNTVIDEKINSDSNSSFFESNSKDLQINEVSTNKLCNETNVKFNNLNEFKNQLETKEGTNEDLKDDLLELAKEMKDSALRFGELMKKEKKILIDLDKEQIYKMDQTTKSTQEMQTLNKLMKMSFINVFTSLRDFTNSVRTIKSSYDYIVIGGGAAGCALARTLAESKYSVLLIERGGTRVEESDLSYDVNGVGRVVDDERVSQLIVTKQGIRTHVANVLGGGTSINMGMIMQEKTDFFKILKDMSGANLNYTLLEESHDWILKKVSNKGDQNLPIVEPLEESFNHINFVTPENPNSDFSVKRVNGTWRVYNIFNVTDNNFRMAADILLSDYESIKKDTVVEKSPVDILTHHFVTKIEFDRIESPKNNPRLRSDQVSFFQSKFSGISSLLNKQNNTKIFTKESTLKAKCIILNRNTFKSSYYDFNEHSKFNFTNEYTKIDMELINPYKSSKELIGNIIAKKICVNKNGMIILSAGSIHTPVLLYKSGIGPSEPLKKMNVMPLLEVENLGTSIVDRMLFAIPFFYKENVSVNPFVNPIMSSFSMKSVNCGYSCDTISIESLGGGRIIEGTLYATRLIFPPRLRNNIVTDFVMEIFKYCAENEFLSGILPICLLLKYPLKCLRKSAAIFYFTSEPKSRGNLTVKKNGTFELNANYLSDDEDRYNAVLGIKSVIKMIRSGKFDKIAEPGGYFSCPLTILNGIIGVLASAKTEGLFLNKPLTPEFMTELESVYNAIVNYRNTLYPEECFNAADLEKCIQEKNVIFERIATFPPILPDLSDEEAILNLAYNIGTSIWHWAGSVPLGELVENDSFILKGTKNLGVVDASLLKILPRVNPVHTVMSIGRYAGVSILRKRYENEENKKIY